MKQIYLLDLHFHCIMCSQQCKQICAPAASWIHVRILQHLNLSVFSNSVIDLNSLVNQPPFVLAEYLRTSGSRSIDNKYHIHEGIPWNVILKRKLRSQCTSVRSYWIRKFVRSIFLTFKSLFNSCLGLEIEIQNLSEVSIQIAQIHELESNIQVTFSLPDLW